MITLESLFSISRGMLKLPNPILAGAFVLGNLLGDGSLRKPTRSGSIRMTMDQADRMYAGWKLKKAKELNVAGSNANLSKQKRKDKRTGNETVSWRFESRSILVNFDPYFAKVKQPSDPTYNTNKPLERRKVYPPELIDWLKNPLSLAILYMDNGSVQSNQAYIATGETMENEVNNLRKALSVNFGIETTVRRDQGIVVGILVRRKSCGKFISLVKPYVDEVPSLSYKLAITP